MLGTPTDVNWLIEQLKPPNKNSYLVFHEKFELGHMSFHIAKDMWYFENVLQLLAKYNI